MAKQRCAECDCENGGDECNWIKSGPLPSVGLLGLMTERQIKAALSFQGPDSFGGNEFKIVERVQ